MCWDWDLPRLFPQQSSLWSPRRRQCGGEPPPPPRPSRHGSSSPARSPPRPRPASPHLSKTAWWKRLLESLTGLRVLGEIAEYSELDLLEVCLEESVDFGYDSWDQIACGHGYLVPAGRDSALAKVAKEAVNVGRLVPGQLPVLEDQSNQGVEVLQLEQVQLANGLLSLFLCWKSLLLGYSDRDRPELSLLRRLQQGGVLTVSLPPDGRDNCGDGLLFVKHKISWSYKWLTFLDLVFWLLCLAQVIIMIINHKY